MKRIVLACTLLSGIVLPLSAQDSTKTKEEAFTFEASYIGDNINNLSGGIKRGSSYLGMANLRVLFDTQNAGLWKGGSFYLNAANTHGATPSADMLGDVQVVSNIDAGDHTYVQELWFKQTIGRVDLIAGLQDLNVEFANTENGAVFMNSSFGIMPLISANIAAPIFPLTSLGLTVKWNMNEKITWLNALYDGSPTDFEHNPHNLTWGYHTADGILAISELQYNLNINELPGTYKLGAFSHSHFIDQDIPDSLNHTIFSFYSIVDQKVWQQGTKSLGVFAQLGYSPSKVSTTDLYVGGGINYNGLFRKEGDDVLGLAFAYNYFNEMPDHETTIELTYYYPLTKNIFIQPDFQYIIHPAATGGNLDNCLTANLRFGFTF